jgi:putative transcriptional regulator
VRQWLKEARIEKELTQQKIADIVGIRRAYYTMIEKGVRNPSVDVAKKISNVLGINWTIFF